MRALVIAREQSLALGVVASLAAAGRTVDAAGEDRFPPLRASRHLRRYLALGAGAFEARAGETAARLRSHCRASGVDVIVPADLDAGLFAARHAGALDGVRLSPTPSADLAARFHDKAAFQRILEGLGVPHPATVVLERLEPPPGVDWSVPRFIKPALGSFSVGAVRLDRPEDLVRYAAGPGAPCAPPFLLQEFVPGVDIDLNVLALDGRVVASSVQRMGPDAQTRVFVEHPAVDAIGRRVVEGTGYHGPVHLDMRIDARSGGVVVLEANPRFWASLGFSAWAGLNFADLSVRAALGEPLGSPACALGPCRQPRLRPAALAAGLALGRMSSSDRAAWQATFGDVLPQVVRKVHELARRAAALGR